MRLLLCIIGLFHALWAMPFDPYMTAVTEGEPSANVFNCVNAITGDFFLSEQDIAVRGAEPIRLCRTYISGDGEGEGGGWFFQPHLNLYYHKDSKRVEVVEPNGTVLFYTEGSKKKKRRSRGNIAFALDEKTMGLTNRGNGQMSGRTHPKNITVEMEEDEKLFHVYGASGTERIYKLVRHQKHTRKTGVRYHLIWERLPSGNIIRYGYDSLHRLNAIDTNNPSLTINYAWIKVHYLNEERPDFDVETSDSRHLSYRYNKDNLLLLVESPEHAKEYFDYLNPQKTCGPLIGRCTGLKNLHQMSVGYYRLDKPNELFGQKFKIRDKEDKRCNSVKILRSGPNALYTFLYYPKRQSTEVIDFFGNRTIYRYSEDYCLESIERYSGWDTLINSERFVWNDSNLMSRAFLDEKGGVMMERRFSYDEWGNVIEETLYGNISGRGNEHYSKRYSYDASDLLIREEEENGKATHYSYLSGTDLLAAQFLLDKGKIRKRNFYLYDKDNLVVREIEDDGDSKEINDLTGVTERRIKEIERRETAPFIGLPQFVSEKRLNLETGLEELLSKTGYTYSLSGQVIRKDIYDARDHLRYSLHYAYDLRGNLIEESNAIGQFARSGFDDWGNKITFEDFHNKTTIKTVYNEANCPITIEETSREGKSRLSQNVYDPMGRLIRSTDVYGNSITHTYDALGRLTSKQGACLTETYTYNAAGHRIRTANAKGETTETSYNCLGKPLVTRYPDGSIERNAYHLDGTLSDTIDPTGTRTHYVFDFLGRLLHKAIYSEPGQLLAEESFKYSTFHQLEHIDYEGHIVQYQYDSAGRKIAEIHEETAIFYSYDSLGRLQTKKQGDIIETTDYDLLGRPIKESSFSQTVEYTYDAFGNKSSITRFIAGQSRVEQFVYDAFNRPVRQIDGLGNSSYISYDDIQHQKIYTDPRGVQTIETYDALHRKLFSEKKNPFGELLCSESFTYDSVGNLVRHENERSLTLFEYGPRGRLIELTEAAGKPEQRVTRTRYNVRGQVETLIKPDGTTLNHVYNMLGHLVGLTSSDGTIDYIYKHDKFGRLLSSRDRKTSKATERLYDSEGRLLREVLASGHSFQNTYDESGHRIRFKLPDSSSIHYEYKGLLLYRVTRLDPTGTPLYSHCYSEYDQAGNPLSQELIGNLGTLHSDYDALGRQVETKSSYFHQKIEEFDPTGNITQLNTNNEVTRFTYDYLSELLSEKGHTYTYDAEYNRTSKDETTYTYNVLNQLLSVYSYDLNGNPTTKGDTHYIYDALGRLIEVELDPSRRISFTYDSFHRCIRRVCTVYRQDRWITLTHEDFLYDNQLEIGTASALGYLTHLRVLGRTPKAEMGSAVAFEIESKTYAPLYDLQGSVRALVSLANGEIAETYVYTAFGELEQMSNKIRNPWRYVSKRYDFDLNLYNFGRRFYSPETGRFLTPDPKGFTDSLNLYAYVLNNPLIHADLFGLETFSMGKVVQFVGKMLYNLIFHLIPHNPLRVLSLLVVRCFFGLQNTTAVPPPACPTENIGEASDSAVILHNGMMNDHDMIRANSTKIHNDHGAQVSFSHNNTQGFMTDLLEAIGGLFGFQNDASRNAASNLREKIAQVGSDGEVIAVAHSQGGIDLKNALKLLTPEERAMIHVRTFGSPTTFEGTGLKSVRHYASSRDPISWICNPIACLKALFSPDDSQVSVLPSKGGIFDHSFDGPTYQDAVNRTVDDLLRK